jgi:hypothetical protein
VCYLPTLPFFNITQHNNNNNPIQSNSMGIYQRARLIAQVAVIKPAKNKSSAHS